MKSLQQRCMKDWVRVKTKPNNYDKTQARRQAKRRSLFNRMRDALRVIECTTTDPTSRRIAQEGLDESKVELEVD